MGGGRVAPSGCLLFVGHKGAFEALSSRAGHLLLQLICTLMLSFLAGMLRFNAF